VTLPLPVPVAPLTIVIHPALVVDVQVQAEPVDTEIGMPVPPAAPIDTVIGVTE